MTLPFGPAVYVFTTKLSTAIQAAERLTCGIVGVNDLIPATAQCPFGGIKDSGYGREGGYQGLVSSSTPNTSRLGFNLRRGPPAARVASGETAAATRRLPARPSPSRHWPASSSR